MQKNNFTAQVESLNSQGQGICSFEGLKVFLDNVLPGELIRATLTTRKKNYGLGELISIQQPSSMRQNPPCALFQACGGCQVMHMKPQEQLAFKTQKVQEALKRIGQIKMEVLPCLPSPNNWAYRNKIQLPFFVQNEQIQLGLYQKRSHTPIGISQCLIHGSLGEKVLKTISTLICKYPLEVYKENKPFGLRHLLIKSALFNKQCLVIFIAGSNKLLNVLQTMSQELMKKHPEIKGVLLNINKKRYNTITGDETRLLNGQDYILEKILGLSFKISSHSFFQVNPMQAENLYQKVLQYADLQKDSKVLDAYCGIGTLSLLAAQRAEHVTGIECVSAAIENAHENMRINQISNVQFMCAHVENVIDKLPSFDIIFLNPPRKGCEEKVLKAIINRAPKKLIYVSCDPATLARDLHILTKNGFSLKIVQPLDMFPQTAHVETIAVLES